jgi:hypothetical protein
MAVLCDIGCYDLVVPSQVNRFLRKAPDARALLDGNVWLSTLSACREYEAIGQGDPDEARHRYNTGNLEGHGDDPEFRRRAAIGGFKVHPGTESIVLWQNQTTTTLHDAYVLCFSEHDSPGLRQTFGEHRVTLRDVTGALVAITAALGASLDVTTAALGRIRYRPRYSEGEEASAGPLGFVKPAVPFEPQREWRMLWTVARPHEYRPFLLACDSLKGLCTEEQ